MERAQARYSARGHALVSYLYPAANFAVLFPDRTVLGQPCALPQLHAPVGLALHESPHGAFLFCADSRNHRIAVFVTTPHLRFVRTFASHGSGPGELGPTSSGIYLACSEGELFVADRANHRLQVFSTEGNLLRSIGQRGTAPGCFRRIRGVAVHRRKIFTAECERVQVLSLSAPNKGTFEIQNYFCEHLSNLSNLQTCFGLTPGSPDLLTIYR